MHVCICRGGHCGSLTSKILGPFRGPQVRTRPMVILRASEFHGRVGGLHSSSVSTLLR